MELRFTSCLSNPYVCMYKTAKPDGFKYWECVIIHTGDMLAFSHGPHVIM